MEISRGSQYEYLDRSEQWRELAQRIRAAGTIGLDTEFNGLDITKQSCVGRARIHVWSVAISTEDLEPVGYHRAASWVLSVDALRDPALRGVIEDREITKYVHNLPVDAHALANCGVTLRGGINTLGLVRWRCPWLVTQPGRFGLKSLMNSLLHREPFCTFDDLVSYTRTETVAKVRREKFSECSCGVAGCRKRTGHVKTRGCREIVRMEERPVDDRYPLESIVPGHPRWEMLLRYAADDAVAALQIAEVALDTPDPPGWPFGGERPPFNQRLEEAIIEMERVGIPIDVAHAEAQATLAADDEEEALAWLRRWYAANELPERNVDAIWSSPKQLLELFDSLDFPRSPVWKLGRVRRGEVKLDATAMEWIARARPDARQLIDKLLHLKKIRAGKKYLLQLVASGGTAHPTYGPAGDADDRSGAVTGRLGAKGELASQQLPSREEVDLYKIKRAIIP